MPKNIIVQLWRYAPVLNFVCGFLFLCGALDYMTAGRYEPAFASFALGMANMAVGIYVKKHPPAFRGE